ncbi:MAG: hypothetical protein IJV00_07670 [Clostridia bacterium]|nr:hypothetical protein [Clostridia bacterium]
MNGSKPFNAYAMFLTQNYCREDEYPMEFTYGYKYVELPYEKTVTKDIPTFEKLCDKAKECGFEKILIFTGDALRYDTHPEIALPGAWTKEELKRQIQRIKALGMEPVPMLDFSAAHDAWLGEYSRMLCTKEYYKVCADLIGELCELFGKPSLFWLGLANENEAVQERYKFINVRDDLQKARDTAFYIAECRRNGAKPWLCGELALTSPELFMKTVDKDVLIGGFIARDISAKAILKGDQFVADIEVFRKLAPLGYQITPALNAFRTFNVAETVTKFLSEYFSDEEKKNVAGFVRLPFIAVREENVYKLLFEAEHNKKALDAWNG